VQIDTGFDDGQPQTRTVNRADVSPPTEGLKQAVYGLRWDAHACIDRFAGDVSGLTDYLNRDGAAIGRIFDRIGKEIAKDLPQQSAIAREPLHISLQREIEAMGIAREGFVMVDNL
jgi:hypothetical protein